MQGRRLAVTTRQALPLHEQGHYRQHMRLTICWASISCLSYDVSIKLLQLLAGILQLHRVFWLLQIFGVNQE